MGCGGSKLEGDDDTAPPGLRPFRRRIDEIRQRRSGRTLTKDPGALSSKQLLHDESEEGHHQDQTTDATYCEIRKSVSSSPAENENVASTNKDATTEKEQNNDDHHYHPMDPPESEMRMSVSPSPDAMTEVPLHCRTSAPENDQKNDDNNNNNNNNNVESDRPDVAMVSQGKEGEDEEKEGKRQEDDSSGSGDEKEREGEGDGSEIGPGSPSFSREGGYLYEDGREIGPGSPSFRDYFLSANNAAESDSGDAGNGEDMGVKIKEDKPPRRKDSSSSNEGSVDKAVKKESKGRMFKNVLPKGRQGAKNLWNVRSCYHPSATSSVHGKDGKVDA
ncbi:uncharacterized protein DDB_G0290685-like [Macadamia integrifolia]|uniref:uncharacterized protein DDB_G0290685-like n=1 Tax=Macadamia integrifolia TaxID=60698 RepID=UPI001C4E3F24|nr:uncharacterized protein DDB_G0290685-like [Macadamia integrifolia]